MNKIKFSGQGIIEYALMLVFIAVVVLVALRIFGPNLGNVFSDINTELISI
jgi:pilus assembly protein Flp/PilA